MIFTPLPLPPSPLSQTVTLSQTPSPLGAWHTLWTAPNKCVNQIYFIFYLYYSQCLDYPHHYHHLNLHFLPRFFMGIIINNINELYDKISNQYLWKKKHFGTKENKSEARFPKKMLQGKKMLSWTVFSTFFIGKKMLILSPCLSVSQFSCEPIFLWTTRHIELKFSALLRLYLCWKQSKFGSFPTMLWG